MTKKSKKSKKSSEKKRAKRKEEKRRESQRKEVRKLLKKQYRNLSLRELRSKRTTIARSDSNDARIPLIDRYIQRRSDEAAAQAARDAKERADTARKRRRGSEKKSEAKFSLEDLYTPEQLALLLGTKQRKEPEKKGDSGREVKNNKKRKRAATPDWRDDFDDEFVPVRNEGDPLPERKRPPPPGDVPDEDEVLFTLNHGETLDEADEDELLKWNNNRVRVDVYYTDVIGEHAMHLTLTNSNNDAQQAVRRFLRGNWWSGPHIDRSGGVDSEELETILNLANITRIEFVRIDDPSRIPRSRAEVAKCPFELDSVFSELAEDLKAAQIYIKGSEIPRDAKQCMIHTFTYFGLPAKEVEAVLHKHTVKRLKNGWERSTSVKVEPALREIAAHFKKKIVFHFYTASGTRNGKPRFKTAAKSIAVEDADDTPPMHVGSFANHVFPNNEIDATVKYLRQPETCVELSQQRGRARDLYKIRSTRTTPWTVRFKPKGRRILDLLNNIDEKHKIPLKCDQSMTNSAVPEMKVPPLTAVLDQKAVKTKRKERKQSSVKKTRSFYSIDIETDISSQAEHQVLLVGYKRIPKASAGESEELQTIPEGPFKVKATVTAMLNDIAAQVKKFFSDEKATHEVTLFAHNAKYDFSLMKASLPKIKNIISKGVSTIYGVSFTHLGVSFTLKDSYKYMKWPLKDTAKTLGLDPEKYSKIEYAAYSFFNSENVRAGALPVPLEDYLACYNRENKSALSATQFISCTDSRFWYVGANDVLMFWARNYYVYYLELDVEILLQGLLKMDKVLQGLGAELKGCVVPSLFSSFIYTIPGIAREFFTANGALDDSFQACGQLKEFAHESFYGGRVISNSTSSDIKVSYEDACSLYPSAMVEAIKELGGIVRGGCKLLEDHEKNMEFLSTVQYYLVRVKVTGMDKKQSCQVGVLPERRDNKVIYHWKWEGKEFTGVYGKIMLEDAIDILGLQYEILEGVYWNTPGTPNNKYSTLTQQLYDTRVQYKKTNKALAEVIKLILNSGTYGCLARKPCYTKSVCVDMKKSRMYSANQFDDLDRWRPLSQHTMLFERNCVDENYTSVVTACIVLDMSKKIMNRVFSACSQESVVIPYSDTDSFVIEQDKLQEVIKIYEENNPGLKYQGNELGQFHSDFSIPDGAPKNTPQSDVVSTQFYNLGKKLYLHLTECTDPKTGQVFKGYKMSCKGFTKTGLIHFAQQEFKQEDERRALQELFKAVDEGREYEINLFPTRESRIEFNTRLVASSVNNIEKPFIRTMKKTGNSEEEDEISILFV